MEILKHIHTSLGEIYLWKVENYSARIASGERKRNIESSEVRMKLSDLGLSNEIFYKDNGQPFLKDLPQIFISISHSNGVLALYIAPSAVGIDVEHQRASLHEGRRYFVNEQEENLLPTTEMLQLIWGAKEAFYKKMEGQIADLKEEVSVLEFHFTDKSLGLIFNSGHYNLRYERWNDCYLVYTL